MTRMAGSGLTRLKIVGNVLKWRVHIRKGWKWLEIAGIAENVQNWLRFAGMAGNDWKWQEMTGNGWNGRKLLLMAVNGR